MAVWLGSAYLVWAALWVFPAQGLPTSTFGAEGSAAQPAVHWSRHYDPGERLTYEMKGSNQGWEYQIQANDLVRLDAAGTPYEEISWSNLKSNAPMTLSPASLAFRQKLSLDGTGKYLAIPDLSKVQPFLIGPITDLLTFYSDLRIAQKEKLMHVGQHAYFAYGKPDSWADGRHVLVGQDSIDFDVMMTAADAERHTATLLIQHVPPAKPQIEVPAAWMETTGGVPNNFVQVEKAGDTYIAEAGKETFVVNIVVDTRDGKILSVLMDNPVFVTSRTCEDAVLTRCGAASPETIHRQVSLILQSGGEQK